MPFHFFTVEDPDVSLSSMDAASHPAQIVPVCSTPVPALDVSSSHSAVAVPHSSVSPTCTGIPASSGASTTITPSATVSLPDAKHSNSSASKNRRGRFAVEYEKYRSKQDQYYDLLLKQTVREHEEQMRIYKIKREAAEMEKRMYDTVTKQIVDTCERIVFLANSAVDHYTSTW